VAVEGVAELTDHPIVRTQEGLQSRSLASKYPPPSPFLPYLHQEALQSRSLASESTPTRQPGQDSLDGLGWQHRPFVQVTQEPDGGEFSRFMV